MKLVCVGLLILALSLAALQVSANAVGVVRASAGRRAAVVELLSNARPGGAPGRCEP